MNKQLEAILEGQKKAFEYWSNLSSQMAKSFPAAEEPKRKMNGEDLLTEWFNKQKAFFEKAMQIGSPQEAMEKVPQQFSEWLDMQRSLAEKWLSYWRDQTPSWNAAFPRIDGETIPGQFFQQGLQEWKKWFTQSEEWMRSQMMDKMPYSMRPHYSSFLQVYDQLLHYWEPISRLIQNGIVEKDIVEKFFSKNAYEEIVSQIMGFKPVGNVSELIDNVNHWFDQYINYTKGEWQKWNSRGEEWQSMFQNQLERGNMPIFQTATDITNHLREQVMPFHNIMAQGRQTEIVKLLRDIQFSYITFLLKSTELQSKVYEAGQFALPDTLKTYQETGKKGESLPVDFQKFFNDYINNLEDSMIEVLSSDEYSALQNDVARMGTKINALSQQVMELMLVELPFLTKSDGDDIAKENHALRTKMRKMESRLAELESRLKSAAAPTPKEEAKKKLTALLGNVKPADRDDLQQIKGIGPKLEEQLNAMGIYTFRQLSRLTDSEYELIDSLLEGFQGRGRRDHWAEQAKAMLN